MTPRKKVLLVDDSSTSRMLEQMILRGENYQIICAKDGLEGVEVALREQPDLILMDAVMPRLDGYDAVARIRQAGRTTPIIMVTTRSEAFNVERGYASGCSEYVVKPVDAVELLAKVKSALGAA